MADAQQSRGRQLAALGTAWLLVSALMAATRWGTGRLIGEHDLSWPEALVHGVLVGAAVTGVTWFTRTPPGSAPQQVTSRAIRCGRLPDDVDAGQLRTGLRHVRRLLVLGRRWCGGLFLGVVVLCGVVAVVTGTSGYLLAAAGLVVLTGALLLAGSTWQLRRVDRLLAELDRRPAELA